ncbi:MAG: hypothetical protein KA716_31870 [Gloeotrichia echinulata DEX184]|nr:hypothetical protein [Gloeotrichia echinulata DEX184]MCM0594534.1 hypothetical protein [Gloeotrichia echinulata DEX184]
MTSYCNIGEKAVLSYSFNGDSAKSRVNFEGTVDVTVSTKNGDYGNGSDAGYEITFYNPHPSYPSTGRAIVRDYYIASDSQDGNFGIAMKAVKGILCDGSLALIGYIYYGVTPTINLNAHCPVSIESRTRDTLTVKKNGTVIFTVEGKNPVTYNVVCGDTCPDGYCKCATTNYPGYCCLPCQQVATQLANIVAIARSKR